MPNKAIIKKIHYQCKYRGTRELDLALRRFEDNGLNDQSDDLPILLDLLNEPEHFLTRWLLHNDDCPEYYVRWVLAIRQAQTLY